MYSPFEGASSGVLACVVALPEVLGVLLYAGYEQSFPPSKNSESPGSSAIWHGSNDASRAISSCAQQIRFPSWSKLWEHNVFLIFFSEKSGDSKISLKIRPDPLPTTNINISYVYRMSC